MEILKEKYYDINLKFENYKKNSPNALLIEIFNKEEEMQFFMDHLAIFTKKLFHEYGDGQIKYRERVVIHTLKKISRRKKIINFIKKRLFYFYEFIFIKKFKK